MKLSAALLALTLAAPVSPGLLSVAPVAAQESEATSLTPAQAEAAAELLLGAIEKSDAATVHSKLADSIKNSVSVESIQKRLDTDLNISSSRVVKVGSGYSDTSVDALITNKGGEFPALLILDDEGKLLAWKLGGKDTPIEATAQSFTEELAAGRWVQARSRLQIDFQKELAPSDLERKWTKLTRISGGFRSVKDAVAASQVGEQQLVLVCVEFAKATTNLFVIFDDQGRIINVDISRDFV